MRTLREDGLVKVLSRRSSLEEWHERSADARAATHRQSPPAISGRHTDPEDRSGMIEFSEMITTGGQANHASDLHLAVGAPPVMRVQR